MSVLTGMQMLVAPEYQYGFLAPGPAPWLQAGAQPQPQQQPGPEQQLVRLEQRLHKVRPMSL